jgi:hypothetical protein
MIEVQAKLYGKTAKLILIAIASDQLVVDGAGVQIAFDVNDKPTVELSLDSGNNAACILRFGSIETAHKFVNGLYEAVCVARRKAEGVL